MAPNGRKKVTVQYRKFDDIAGAFGVLTLHAALASCMKQPKANGLVGDDAACRKNENQNYGTIVLNAYEDKPEFFFGEFVRFDPGADLPLLQMQTGAKAYNLTQAHAPDGHEPVKGVLYLMAIGNHAILIENDLSTGRVENYLSWLLGEGSGTVGSGAHVMLVAELAPQSGAQQLSQVEQIVFKPKPVTSMAAAPSEGSKEEIATIGATSRGVADTNAFEVLRAAGMDDVDIERMVQDNTQIEVTLQIKFKGKRKRKPLGITDANRLLRNIPEDELTLIGPGGRQKEGRIVKLSYPANVELIGSLLKTPDVVRALHEGYKYFVTNGYIDG